MSRALRLIVSLLITAVCLWWTFKDTKWEPMWNALKSANWAVTLPVFLGSLLVIHVARVLRWGNLLSPLEKVPFKQLNEASAIGFMMLVLLPFRLGEFARPFLIAQRSGIRRSAAMTSVVLERIFDGLIIATLLWVLMFFVPADARGIGAIRTGATLMFAVFGGGFVFLLFARWKHELVISLLRRTAGKLSAGATEKLIHIVDGFVGALRQLPDAKNFALFFGWTAIYWFANGAGMTFFANGFDCSGANGAACEPLELTLFQGFFMLCVSVVGMLIPAAPGSAGTAHAALKLALLVFLSNQVVESSGAAFINVVWLLQLLQQVVMGLIFMVLSRGNFSDLAGKLSEQQKEAQT